MVILKRWLKDGAGIGIDEHVRNDEVLTAIAAGARRWAEEEVYPKVRTLSPDILEGLPSAEPSALEGAGSEDVIGAFLDNFEVESFESRYIALNALSFLYYLSRMPDNASYEYAGNIIHHIYRFLMDAFPDGAEYVVLIGRKVNAGEVPRSNELAERARKLARGDTTLIKDQLKLARQDLAAAHASIAEAHSKIIERDKIIADKNRHIEQLERWARTLERDLHTARNTPLARAGKRASRLIKRK
jgi:hypothetical protein